jgi:hypothetical protein
MMTILDRILGRQRVLVKENERAIGLYKGEMLGILGPGEHSLPNRRNRLDIFRHDLKGPELVSVFEKALFDKLPDVAARHLTVFRTGKTEVAIVERDGQVHAVVAPDRKLVVWTDAGLWAATVVDVAGDLAVEPAVMRRLAQAGKAGLMSVHAVVDGQAGLLFVDGAYAGTFGAGVHGFWNVGKTVQVKVIDLKRQSLDVAGPGIA